MPSLQEHHCHILELEDRDMMRPFVIMPPELMPFNANLTETYGDNQPWCVFRPIPSTWTYCPEP